MRFIHQPNMSFFLFFSTMNYGWVSCECSHHPKFSHQHGTMVLPRSMVYPCISTMMIYIYIICICLCICICICICIWIWICICINAISLYPLSIYSENTLVNHHNYHKLQLVDGFNPSEKRHEPVRWYDLKPNSWKNSNNVPKQCLSRVYSPRAYETSISLAALFES